MVAWNRVEEATRDTRTPLSYERIAQAGIRIADAEGLDAVTMRRVAKDLGAGTMSLYRYVDNRDDLLSLMSDLVSAEAIAPPPTGEWRTDLSEIAHTLRRVTLRHPWMAGRILRTTSFGPHTLAMAESTLTLIDGHGLSMSQLLDIWRTIVTFVRGFALAESIRAAAAPAPLDDTAGGYLRSALDSGKYPLVSSWFTNTGPSESPDEAFERRLSYVLDGISANFPL
jgi:AcrR family transcriptional regulator